MTRLIAVLKDVCVDLPTHGQRLNELDGFAGDGDLGVTMSTAAHALLDLLPQLEERPLQDILRACGTTLAREAPSTAGTLLATGLLRAAAATDGDRTAAESFSTLLEAARAGIAERGGADLGSKTLLDALTPAAKAATANTTSLTDAVRSAAEAADTGARKTTTMQARHGRAGWLADRSMGHEDAGARLIAIVLASAARALTTTDDCTG